MFNIRKSKIINPKYLPWLIWSSVLIFYAYRYALDVFPGVAVQPLMQSFNVNATKLGILSSLFFYPYALLQIPIGMVLDQFGARKLLTKSALLCAIGTLLFALANHFWLAALGRFIMGFGAAATAVSAFYITATWLPKKHFTFFSGLIVSIGILGVIFGQVPIAALVEHYRWQHAMLLFTVLGVIIALLMWFVVKDKKNVTLDAKKIRALEKEGSSLTKKFLNVTKNPQNWLVSLYGGIMFMPTIVFGSLWGIPFLMHRLPNFSTPQAAALVTLFFIGWGSGAPIVGKISDHFAHRKLLMLLIWIGTMLGLLYTFYWPNPCITLLSLALFIAGFSAGGSIVICSLMRDLNRNSEVGTAMGFMNMLNMGIGTLGQPLIGILLDYNWQGKFMPDGTRFYTLVNYQHSFGAIIIIFGIALLTLAFIRDPFYSSR